MDDDFMSKVFDRNIEATQLLLNIILERTDIKVESVKAQREFKTVIGHSVKFDIFAKDVTGKPYDIEIQRSDKGASPKRARYNNSVLDTYLLEKGKDYTELTETYIIFITENDVLGKNLPLYHMERKVLETDELFDDGSHIIFVNGQYNNPDNAIGKLMHDFRCTKADDMHYSQLADKVRYFKETEGGSSAMCKMMEEMRKNAVIEKATENALKMLKDNIPLEKVAEYSGLSLDEIQILKKNHNL
ncbi:MAG: PD-(D/E)XK nuclease family transposase [Clostridia bacterium]|nr:PD-(D/E)XK nuclease family transposase [Clostridia bacterium]